MVATVIDKGEKARHGNSKVTREDWLKAARDRLVAKGVSDVKVLSLSNELGVARSSFYWYFQDRSDLLNALLEDWEQRNTQCIVDKCAQEAGSIAEAVCHFFECFIDPQLFDQRLDFAVREWSRRNPAVRAKIDTADQVRLECLEAVFRRHGFDAVEANARARILYFMQLGYHALDISEPMETRMARLEGYLKGFTGEPAPQGILEEFRRRAFELGGAI